MSKELKKVVGYIRVSSPGQAKEGESLNTQKDNIKHFAKIKGWELLKIYEDRGISGAKAENRPGFMEMIRDAEQKKFNGIVFSRFSRFARNASDFLFYVDKLKQNGVTIFSIKEGIDPSTKTGELMMGFMSLIAAWERELIREQMLENKMVKWREKRMFNGRPTYGYKWDKEKQKLVVNKDEAKIYKRIVDMYLNHGMSFRRIALKLRDEGILCKKAPFSSIVISGILKHPAYYGRYVVNRFKYKPSDKAHGRLTRTKELKDISENIFYEVEPLISKADWDRLQKKTAFNTIKSKRSGAQDQYWLRDVLLCGECGGVVKPHNGAKRKDGTRPRYYGCYWAESGPQTLKLANKKKCSLPLIKAEKLEAQIWAEFMRPFALNKEKLSALIGSKKHEEEIEALGIQIMAAESALKKKENDSKKTWEIFYDDKIRDKNKLSQRINSIDDEIRDIRSRLDEARRRREELMASKNDTKLLQEFVSSKKTVLKKLWSDLSQLSHADKKRIMDTSLDGQIILRFEEEYGADAVSPDCPIRLNKAILQSLRDEGKITGYGKDTPLGPSPDEL